MIFIKFVPDRQLLLDTSARLFVVIVTMIGHSQLIVQVSYVLANFRANDLPFYIYGLKHELLGSCKLLLLAQLDSDTLHRARLLLFGLLCSLACCRIKSSAGPASSIHDCTCAFRLDRDRS